MIHSNQFPITKKKKSARLYSLKYGPNETIIKNKPYPVCVKAKNNLKDNPNYKLQAFKIV